MKQGRRESHASGVGHQKQGPGSEATTTGRSKAWAAKATATGKEARAARKPRLRHGPPETRPGQRSHDDGQKQGLGSEATTTGRSKAKMVPRKHLKQLMLVDTQIDPNRAKKC